MNLLGEQYGQEFCSLLIQKYLETSEHKESKKQEDKLLAKVVQMRYCLINFGFLNEEEICILGYITGFKKLSAKKMEEEKLVQARQLMKMNLYPSKLVGEIEISFQTENFLDSGSLLNNLQFPACQISSSTDEILSLLHQTLKEACLSSPETASCLYLTSRLICKMYIDIVPCYHKDALFTSPEQNAVFYNNCLYLSHHLTRLGVQYQIQLSKASQGQLVIMTFSDLAGQFKRLGADIFLIHIRKQRGQLLDYLQEGCIFQRLPNDLMTKGARVVQLCLQQLFSLKNAWIRVLPLREYQRVMGTLCNSVLEEIISKLLIQKDIHEKSAFALDTVMGIVIEKFPIIFQTTVSMEKVVPLWKKFKELRLFLNSSLSGIVDRWISGFLVLEFSKDQVRQLIRALFKDSERRAAALAKI